MLFKIDENLHPDVASLLREHGHDVKSVWDQGLQGTPDANLAGVCRAEGRALITLDLDFADIRTYPPEDYHGLIVLRLADQARTRLFDVFDRVVPLLDTEPLAKQLWIVDELTIRIRGASEEG